MADSVAVKFNGKNAETVEVVVSSEGVRQAVVTVDGVKKLVDLSVLDGAAIVTTV